MLLLIAGWRFYSGWRMGRVELLTEGEPVVAQVLEENSDTAIGEPFDVASRAVKNLPEGEYRLRVDGSGRLGRTYRFGVVCGETQVHTISIDEGRLLGHEHSHRGGAMRIAPLTWAIELAPGRADLIEVTERSLVCRDGATGTVRWGNALSDGPADSNRDLARWIRSHVRTDVRHGGLVEPAPDLNGDGTGDLVWFAQDSAQLRAISGKDGSKLWDYLSQADGLGRDDRGGGETKFETMGTVVAGEPAITDVDRDGIPDLIATFIFSEALSGRRIVAGISGRSGRRLWTHLSAKTEIEIPWESRRRPAVLVKGRGATLVAYSDGTTWVGLDPASGEVRAGPIDIGFVPVRPVQHADLDGDGEPEVLALGPGEMVGQKTLRAFSVKSGRELWAETVDEVHDQGSYMPLPSRPRIIDLDHDGRSEIVVPDSGALPPLAGYRGVRLLDGASGRTRWSRPLRPETPGNDGLVYVAVAPDLNGDGTRDLVTVSLYDGRNAPPAAARAVPEERRLYIDALSGKDGRVFWVWHRDLVVGRTTRIWTPQWWGRGPDGWPMLVVALGGWARNDPFGDNQNPRVAEPEVHVLEASTGRERHRVPGLARASVADLDGDGLADLWGDVGGEVRAFRGEVAEAWRALGRFGPAGSSTQLDDVGKSGTVDLDGDTIADTVGGSDPVAFLDREAKGSHVALARSGQDGHVIWKTVLDPWDHWSGSSCTDWYDVHALQSRGGDLDGDGTPDVIARRFTRDGPSPVIRASVTLPIQLLSGRTGARLWSAGEVPPGSPPQVFRDGTWVQTRAVELNGAPDVFVRHYSSPATPSKAPTPVRLPRTPSLARISGRDGRVLWDVALAENLVREGSGGIPPLHFEDLDGDGRLDGLILSPSTRIDDECDYRLLAISLRDGKRLWAQPLRYERYGQAEFCVGDIDGDRQPDVAVIEVFPDGQRLSVEVRALDRRDGKTRWTWNPGTEFHTDRANSIVLADFQGNETNDVCVCLKARSGVVRIVVIDGNGKEHARRDVAGYEYPTLTAGDVNGDGRDELFVWYAGQLHALDRDLKEIWSSATESTNVCRIFAPSAGRAGLVVVNPALALDGVTGRPRWTGQASPDLPPPDQLVPDVLDAGDSTRLPLLISHGLGATVCRAAMAMTPEGRLAALRGRLVEPRRQTDDPRWMRVLPWSGRLVGALGPWGFLIATGLALVNVGVPVLIVYAACGRRRIFSIRALMMLPVAAAVPLMVYLALLPRLPVSASPLIATESRAFIIGTLAGLPVAWGVACFVTALARGRLKLIAGMAGLVVLATLAVAGGWLWMDRKSMAAIEHYGWEGWCLVLLPGVYAAAVCWLMGRGVWGVLRTRSGTSAGHR